MDRLEQELRRFVVENYLFGEGDGQLSNDDSFLDKGIIDSTGVLELVSHLEKTYAIKVQDEELIPENLDSVNRLTRFLRTKLPPST
jgi:acyl carrier protein